MPDANETVKVQRLDSAGVAIADDQVTVEEPLEIRLNQGGDDIPIVVTMRTPGNDNELAVGFLFNEGIIRDRDDLKEVGHCGNTPESLTNVIRVSLRDQVKIDQDAIQRNFYTNSACGICGKTSIEQVQAAFPTTSSSGCSINPDVLTALPGKLKAAQVQFALTGGLHSAALFDAEGNITNIREDVGRHNALDKLVGAMVSLGKPMSEQGLLLSGRVSFELVQKAAMAGISTIAALGPPSTLALSLAQEQHMSVVGFLSDERFNIYINSGHITGIEPS